MRVLNGQRTSSASGTSAHRGFPLDLISTLNRRCALLLPALTGSPQIRTECGYCREALRLFDQHSSDGCHTNKGISRYQPPGLPGAPISAGRPYVLCNLSARVRWTERLRILNSYRLTSASGRHRHQAAPLEHRSAEYRPLTGRGSNFHQFQRPANMDSSSLAQWNGCLRFFKHSRLPLRSAGFSLRNPITANCWCY